MPLLRLICHAKLRLIALQAVKELKAKPDALAADDEAVKAENAELARRPATIEAYLDVAVLRWRVAASVLALRGRGRK